MLKIRKRKIHIQNEKATSLLEVPNLRKKWVGTLSRMKHLMNTEIPYQTSSTQKGTLIRLYNA